MSTKTKPEIEKAGHTPGPWGVSRIGNHAEEYVIYSEADSKDLAVVAYRENNEANTRLIAAAPALLAACKAALQSAERGELVVIQQRNSHLFPGCGGVSQKSEDGTKQMMSELRAAIAQAEGRAE